MPKVEYPQGTTSGLVTVVIPAYRMDDYIGEALRSIAEQSYADWEVIVVEDASHGKTEEIVEQFAKDHPKHRIVYRRNEKNSGPSHSRNVAFLEARGEFIALLDADDRWLPTHLSVSVQGLRQMNSDVVYSSVVLIEDQTELLLGMWGPDHRELESFPNGLFRRCFIIPSATVFRRSVIENVGLWTTDLRLCEDFDYWLRCLTQGKKFAHLGGCHCFYRQNRLEAATKNKCAVQESFARVAERYIRLPGTVEATCRKQVARAFARAARVHYKGDCRRDPSRDPRKIPGLFMKAWKLRPTRVDYLLRAAWASLANTFRQRPTSPTLKPVSLQSGQSCQVGS